MTPPYYIMEDGSDLYAMFNDMFPEQSIVDHLKMVAIEYIMRAGKKHALSVDAEKAILVLSRLQELFPDEGPTTGDSQALPEKVVQMWCEINGYELVRKHSMPQRVGDYSFPTEDIQTPINIAAEIRASKKAAIAAYEHNGMMPSHAPMLPPSRGASILDAAISYWEDREQKSIMTDAKALEHIKTELAKHSFPSHLHYYSHAVKLHDLMPELFPLIHDPRQEEHSCK